MSNRFCHATFFIAATVLLVGILVMGCSGSGTTDEPTQSSVPTSQPTDEPTAVPTPSPPAATATESGNPIAVIHTSFGDITLELFRDKVPNTVDNFVRLARDGFYEGLTFHRIGKGFMIQAGAYTADGQMKQSPYGSIDLEINPEVTHVDGTISMARTSAPNSANSQFFICDGAQHFLDNNYAAFGVVTDGIEVVREIAAQPQDNSGGNGIGRPLAPIIISGIDIR